MVAEDIICHVGEWGDDIDVQGNLGLSHSERDGLLILRDRYGLIRRRWKAD